MVEDLNGGAYRKLSEEQREQQRIETDIANRDSLGISKLKECLEHKVGGIPLNELTEAQMENAKKRAYETEVYEPEVKPKKVKEQKPVKKYSAREEADMTSWALNCGCLFWPSVVLIVGYISSAC